METNRVKPKLILLKKFGVSLRRIDYKAGNDFKEQARVLCAFMIDCFPGGTVQRFCDLTGADYDTILDTGMTIFKER